jgi:hypothetical protein
MHCNKINYFILNLLTHDIVTNIQAIDVFSSSESACACGTEDNAQATSRVFQRWFALSPMEVSILDAIA